MQAVHPVGLNRGFNHHRPLPDSESENARSTLVFTQASQAASHLLTGERGGQRSKGDFRVKRISEDFPAAASGALSLAERLPQRGLEGVRLPHESKVVRVRAIGRAIGIGAEQLIAR